jgi:hypothetical protein
LQGGLKVRRGNPFFLSEDGLPHPFQGFAMTSVGCLSFSIKFMKNVVVLTLITLYFPILHAHPSLFFTQDEMNIINKKENKNNILADSLLLTSLLYIDDTHWAVWINGKCIRPENLNELEDMKIVEVTEHQVKVMLKNSPKTLTLHPRKHLNFQKLIEN